MPYISSVWKRTTMSHLDTFTEISYKELETRHYTRYGILALNDNNASIQIVKRNVCNYEDIFTDDGDTLFYSHSRFKNYNKILNNLPKSAIVYVYLNAKPGYYYCGIYKIVQTLDDSWKLKRVKRTII